MAHMTLNEKIVEALYKWWHTGDPSNPSVAAVHPDSIGLGVGEEEQTIADVVRVAYKQAPLNRAIANLESLGEQLMGNDITGPCRAHPNYCFERTRKAGTPYHQIKLGDLCAACAPLWLVNMAANILRDQRTLDQRDAAEKARR